MTLEKRVHAIVAHAPANPEATPMAVPLTEPWTIAQLDRLPDDGNRYEVLAGELLVTPARSDIHEEFVALLHELLTTFVRANGLGRVYTRGVFQVATSQLEPDLLVRSVGVLRGWKDAPVPLLVVEVPSTATRKRDLVKKRDFYIEQGIPEYWIVDRDEGVVIQVRGRTEERISRTLRWSPQGSGATLEIEVARMFADVRSRM